jgi:hypothetical protein
VYALSAAVRHEFVALRKTDAVQSVSTFCRSRGYTANN